MSLARRFFHRHRAGDLERHFTRIDIVERAVHQLDLHVHHRIAGEDAVLQRLFHALLDRTDVFLGDRAADDVVLEHEAGAGLARLQVNHDVAVLAAAARLADELALDVLDTFADRFAVGDLRAAHVGIDLEFPPHALDDDLEVQLAHAADDGLGGLGIGVHAERGIFLGQLRQRDAQLVLIGLGLRLDGDRDDGVREAHRLENDRMRLVAQRVAGARVLQPDRGRDVAGTHVLDLLALVGVHLQQPPDALPAVFAAVVDVRARAQHAAVHAEERQFPDVRIGHDLERERGERRVIGRGPLGVRCVVMRQMALDRRDVDGRRQIIDDGVEQRLDALVLEGGAADDGDDVSGDRGLADDGADFFFGQRVVFEILVQDGVVGLDAGLDHVVSQLCDLIFQRRGDRAFDVLLPHRLVVVHDLDFAHEVDEAREQLAGAERYLDRHRLRAEPVADHLEAHVEVGADAVHLVDEDDPWHAVAVRLAPHRLGLRLAAAHGIQHGHRTVEDAQAALHFDGEVHVSRGVDDVDAVLLIEAGPESGRRGRRNRDAALLLLLHPVHRGRTFVHLTQLVGAARIVKDTLGRSRFPGIDVRHDADIPNLVERCRAWHYCPLFSKNAGRPGTHSGPVSLRFPPGHRPGVSRLRLPAVVCERPVGLRHPVRVFLLLYRLAFALRRQDQLGRQALGHRLLFARAAVLYDPAHPQRRAPLGAHFDRHLIRRAADAPRLYFQRRLDVRQRLLEHVHAGLPRTLFDHVHRLIEDPLGQRLLAAHHQVVQELRDRLAVVARIGRHRSLDRGLAPAHFPASLGRLAPYFERDCLRSFTPAASSVPRMM